MKNIEFKAQITEEHAQDLLYRLDNFSNNPLNPMTKKGVDQQEDTYFTTITGRLKLRLGPIENCLIAYDRHDVAGEKKSVYELYHLAGTSATLLKQHLKDAMGIDVVVRKERHIYVQHEVKIHVDKVEGLEGRFMEVEVRDETGEFDEKEMKATCDMWRDFLGIKPEMTLEVSYSDLLLQRKAKN